MSPSDVVHFLARVLARALGLRFAGRLGVGPPDQLRPHETVRAAPSKPGAQPHGDWRRSRERYVGHYVIDGARMKGDIRFWSRWDYRFTVLAPPRLVTACGEHSRCFIPRSRALGDGWRWYEVHFAMRPWSVHAGIAAVEDLLGQAAVRMKGGRACDDCSGF